MDQAKMGDTVRVHYLGKFSDGTVFDSSEGGDPIEFKIGDGQIISGFENAVVDMRIGERRTIEVNSEDAYGPYRDDLVVTIGRNQFPPGMEPQVGKQISVTSNQGIKFNMVIVSINSNDVTLDANHPLAGKDLIFDIELIAIVN